MPDAKRPAAATYPALALAKDSIRKAIARAGPLPDALQPDSPGPTAMPMPIPGTTKLHRLDENVGAAGVELSPDDLAVIEAALREIKVVGDRYPAHLQQRVDR